MSDNRKYVEINGTRPSPDGRERWKTGGATILLSKPNDINRVIYEQLYTHNADRIEIDVKKYGVT